MGYMTELKDKCVKKIARTSMRIKDSMPQTTYNGMYDDYSDKEHIRWWTNSFWAGIMWQMYDLTEDKRYMEYAVSIEKRLEAVLYAYETLDHDLGFLWMLTGAEHYKHTEDRKAKNDVLLAASVLASRYDIGSGVIRAWTDRYCAGVAIIDSLMNLPLLYLASELEYDDRFKHTALAHADKVVKNFIREDGSVRHIVRCDTETGELVCVDGGQGYNEHSSWTRGQGWAIYGCIQNYQLSGKKEFLDASMKVANYFIGEAEKSDFRIKCDFRQPENVELYDTSAAAVAACGLTELYRETQNISYLDAARKLITVCNEEFCPWDNENDEALLNYGCGSYSDGKQKALIYGDYYFFKAVNLLAEFDNIE